MSLDLDIRIAVGDFTLEMAMAAADGETVAVLGPNGAGKSTLVRTLAGLSPIEAGHIAIDQQTVDEPATSRFVRPDARAVGVVFQDRLLFPHLSALDNVAFGLRCRHVPRGEARRRAAAWLERVGLDAKADARPAQLSGGEAQRVALARALVVEPRLLLLDEPLGALDVTTKADVRRELVEHLARFTGVRVLVTHDPLEAAALAGRLVVVEQGRVVQEGTFDELTARPRTEYVASLVGTNLFRGVAGDGLVALPDGGSLAVGFGPSGPVLAAVHPRAVVLSTNRPDGSARTAWPGRVGEIDSVGDRCRISVRGEISVVAEITSAARVALGLVPGSPIWASVKATEIDVYPA